MLKTAYWYVLGWVFIFFTLPLLFILQIVKLLNLNVYEKIVNEITSFFCRYLFYISGSKIEIVGAENIPRDESVLFVSNHESHFDNVIIHGFVRKKKAFISIVEVLKIPIIRAWMKEMNCVFLDRKDMKQSYLCIERSAKLLKCGYSFVIFPEGKLNEGKEISAFKKGSLKLAIKAGVAIVPISLINSHKIMNKNGSKIRSTRAKCIIAKPIATAGLSKNDETMLSNRVREIIINNMTS